MASGAYRFQSGEGGGEKYEKGIIFP